jgi:hypothetical protein
MTAWEKYHATWSAKTRRQVEKEIESMQRYMQRNDRAYSWHGAQHAPGEMSDGDRLVVLRDVLTEKEASHV